MFDTFEALTSSPAPTTCGTEPAPGATDVVEAPTAEAAIAAVHDLLGADARIVDARRVLRGGIAGFFATEVVQLHAAAGAPAVAATPPTPPTPAAAPAPSASSGSNSSGHGDDVSVTDPWGAVLRSEAGRPTRPAVAPDRSPVDRLLDRADEEPDAVDFATFLRRRLAEEQAANAPEGSDTDDLVLERGFPVAPSPRAATPDPTPVPAIAGGPPWSVGGLMQLGLPVELVRSLTVAEPADDLAWITALAEATRPSCRPLPAGPAVMLGPHAHLVGPLEGTPAARNETCPNALCEGRWSHLVVGGENWRAALAEQPLAASWARPEDLPDALRCAVELGLVLGFGPMGGRIRRARPLDVAFAVRDLLDLDVSELR